MTKKPMISQCDLSDSVMKEILRDLVSGGEDVEMSGAVDRGGWRGRGAMAVTTVVAAWLLMSSQRRKEMRQGGDAGCQRGGCRWAVREKGDEEVAGVGVVGSQSGVCGGGC